MRTRVERESALFLAGEGKNPCQIARLTGIPRATICGWITQPEPKLGQPVVLDLRVIPKSQYSYLLGLYLGDGTVSAAPKGVCRLRIATDTRYPGIIAECVSAIEAVMPRNRVQIQKLPYRAVVIGCFSKAWPLLFPQHGPGRKHQRKIELEPWQQEIVNRHTRDFLRGLIHSDGCRVLNRVNGKDYPRYFFSQVSEDIRGLFCEACERLGIRYSRNRWNSVSIARAPSVTLMDSFIGPKR